MQKYKWLLAGLILSLAISCGEEKEAYVEDVLDYEPDSVLVEGYEEELVHVRSAIWESSEGYKQMFNAGFSYDNKFSLPPSKLSQYSTNKQKALGLGAFCSYVAYATINNQSQDAINGMNSVMKLAADLKLEKAFDKELFTSIIESAKDSSINVTKILSEAIEKSQRHMHSNDRAELASIMVAGGWIEALHVSVSMLNQNGDKRTTAIDMSVWSHNFKYQNVMKMLRLFENSEDCKHVASQLAAIRKPVWVIISSQNKMKEKQLAALSTSISSVRQELLL